MLMLSIPRVLGAISLSLSLSQNLIIIKKAIRPNLSFIFSNNILIRSNESLISSNDKRIRSNEDIFFYLASLHRRIF